MSAKILNALQPKITLYIHMLNLIKFKGTTFIPICWTHTPNRKKENQHWPAGERFKFYFFIYFLTHFVDSRFLFNAESVTSLNARTLRLSGGAGIDSCSSEQLPFSCTELEKNTGLYFGNGRVEEVFHKMFSSFFLRFTKFTDFQGRGYLKRQC